MPDDFEDIYICDLLGLTDTEYRQQPADWIDRMLAWQSAKAKAQELAHKEAQRKQRRR